MLLQRGEKGMFSCGVGGRFEDFGADREIEAGFAAWGGAGVREEREEDARLLKASQTPA